MDFEITIIGSGVVGSVLASLLATQGVEVCLIDRQDPFKNNKLSNKIMNILGNTIDIQTDYKLIRSDSLNSFVWIGRGYPYRWITIHKSGKNNYLQKISAWDQLKIEFADLMPSIKISEFYKNTSNYQTDKNMLHIMRGIYEHEESASGGPFFVYIFETESVNEVILVSGFVNYPGHEKILLLKQLEIIANTFQKGEI